MKQDSHNLTRNASNLISSCDISGAAAADERADHRAGDAAGLHQGGRRHRCRGSGSGQ